MTPHHRHAIEIDNLLSGIPADRHRRRALLARYRRVDAGTRYRPSELVAGLLGAAMGSLEDLVWARTEMVRVMEAGR